MEETLKKRIGVIFTGGTIGSVLASDNYVSPDAKNPYKVLELYKKYISKADCEELEFIISEPYQILSENLDAKHLVLLVNAVKDMSKKKIQGIVITHGTDTLPYSAAFLDLVFSFVEFPIMIVSSDYPLEDERANGLDNFVCAVDFIKQSKGKGVFVSYHNKGDAFTTIHVGKNVLAHEAFSANVHSIENQIYATYERGNFKVNNLPMNFDIPIINQIDEEKLVCNARRIRWLRVYPQMCLPDLDDCGDIILLETYHSGTMYVGEEFCKWADKICRLGKDIYITGLDTAIDNYETTKIYKKYDIKILPKMSPVAAYCMLWLTKLG